MKIAILGGRFDPPHFGHLKIAQLILEKRTDIEKVIFIPTAVHPWSPIKTRGKDRMEMIRLMLEPGMEVSDLELNRKGVSYTIDTIRKLKSRAAVKAFGDARQNSKFKIYWIVGSDIIPDFDKWKDSEDLKKMIRFLVLPRVGFPLPEKLPEGFEVLDFRPLPYSSSEIRIRLSEGKSIKGLVPDKIEEYIRKNKLYA